MWRYIKAAFWAKMRLPGVGALPVNALAVCGVGILGFAEHAIWLLGVGAETAYLFMVASDSRFQTLVSARARVEGQSGELGRKGQLAALSPEARQRAGQVEEKIRRTAVLYQGSSSDNFLQDSSLDALEKLGALHLRLLCVAANLQTARQQTNEAALARQAAALEKELAHGGPNLSAALRESKQATLALTEKRLANARRRTQSLAEVESDVARIEAQVDLALEDAGLEGNPTAGAANLNLLNRILESNSALTGADPLGGDLTSGPPGLRNRHNAGIPCRRESGSQTPRPAHVAG